MKQLLLFTTAILLFTFFSCSKEDVQVNDDYLLEQTSEEIEDTDDLRVIDVQGKLASLSETERATVLKKIETKKEEVYTALQEHMSKSTPAALRTEVKGLLTVGMNAIIAITPSCPPTATERFRTFSERQYFYPNFTHTCNEPNDHLTAVQAVLDEA